VRDGRVKLGEDSVQDGTDRVVDGNLAAEIDVKGIQKRLKMTQARFSSTFGFSLDAVKHWEGGRRTPESSARAILTVIDRNPGAVLAALHPHLQERTSKTKSL